MFTEAKRKIQPQIIYTQRKMLKSKLESLYKPTGKIQKPGTAASKPNRRRLISNLAILNPFSTQAKECENPFLNHFKP